jgi:microcystin-dependent protein
VKFLADLTTTPGTTGQVLTATTGAAPAWAVLPQSLPAGSLIMFGGSAAPGGWVICDGSAVSRTTFAALFAVIGTTYGVGDGSTTFNLPNFVAAFPRGNTPASNGGSATHIHSLSDAGQAANTIGSATPWVLQRRVTAASWTSTHGGSSGTTVAANGTVEGAATALLGNTDVNSSTALPPYTGVCFIIKT